MAQIAPLTGLRGLAAYAVLIAHAMDASVGHKEGIAHSLAVGLAYFGMSLFFVLSGFVIAYNYEKKLHLSHGRKRFFVARFARLFPLYAVVLLYYAWPLMDRASPIVIATHATMTQSWFNTRRRFSLRLGRYRPSGFSILLAYIIATGKLHTFVGLRALLALSAISVAILSAIFILKPQIETFLAGPLFCSQRRKQYNLDLVYLLFAARFRIFEFVLGVIVARIYSTSKRDFSGQALLLWRVRGACC